MVMSLDEVNDETAFRYRPLLVWSQSDYYFDQEDVYSQYKIFSVDSMFNYDKVC